MVGILVGERRTHVVPVVTERGRKLLLGRHEQFGVAANEVEQGAEALHGQQLSDVGPTFPLIAVGRAERARGGGDLRQLTVLGRELGGGRYLHLLDVTQRALRERGEPTQRFDLDVEHVHAHRVLLGGGEHIEQPSAQRELPAFLHLIDAFVTGAHEILRRTRPGRAARPHAA